MSDIDKNKGEVNLSSNNSSIHSMRKQPVKKVAKWLALGVGGILVLFVALITIATLALTPDRLTEIINREASENLNADVTVHNARFTMWSTFPHFCVEIDSVRVISRSLDGLDAASLNQLPPDSKYLASTKHIKGNLNLLSLLKGEIKLHDFIVDEIDLNLVAVSDSVSNFNIFPSSGTTTKIPYFTADSVVLSNPRHLRYYSRGAQTAVDIDLRKMSLINTNGKSKKDEKNTYNLLLDGSINADVNSLSLLRSFPFDLNGKVTFKFKPFSVKTSDYKIALGNTTGNLSMDLSVGDNIALNQFQYRLEDFNLNELLSYLPKDLLPLLSSVHADLMVNASASLLTPYSFTSGAMPSVEVRFNVPDGELGYTLDKNKTYYLRHVGASGKLMFDGENIAASYFDLPTFYLRGDGMDLSLSARADDVFEHPEVKFAVKGNLNASDASAVISQLNQYNPSGTITTSLAGNFNVSEIKGGELQKLKLDGDVALKNFSFSYNPARLSGRGKSLVFKFGGDAKALNDSAIQKGTVGFSIKGEGLSVASADMSADLDGVDIKFKDIRHLATPDIPSKYNMPKSWNADRRSLAMAPHTPQFLQVALSDSLRKQLASWSGNFSVKVKNATILTPSFPLRNQIKGLNLDGSLDSLVLHKLRLESLSSGMTLSGKVSNLRQFLLSGAVAPLYLNVDAKMDTIQINQLAGAYEAGLRNLGHPVASGPQPSDSILSASDTTTMLIPRNLVAAINVSAKMTQYMNLRLYDLGTGVRIKNGDVSADHLNISSDFGKIGLGFSMRTSNMQNLGLTFNGGINNVELVSFFKNFHTLLLMMPQMKNLKGVLSANMDAKMGFFPNMFVNVPSLNADLRLGGEGLTVHQDKFIRKITKMLMIHNSDDIHIHNMSVNAHVGNNLLELYPFVFEFENYRLNMEGVNNFDGDMFYHIGVEKSPIHIPFGINIEGNFSDPKVRFGGESFKEEKASAVTRSIMETHRINMVQIGRKYLREFLHKAAQSDTTPKEAYTQFGKKPGAK